MSDRELSSVGGEPQRTAPQQPTSGWLQGMVGALRTLVGGKAEAETMRESLEGILADKSAPDTALDPSERRMLFNILAFGALRVDSVMVPRADIMAVEEQTSLDELVATFHEAQHSRLPVYRQTLDHPLGMVHIKDLISLAAPPTSDVKRPSSIKDIVREVLFVPGSMLATDLLVKMQATRIHLALVIDEYGGTDGLVSIEDLVEQIVGDIEDEHDTDEAATLIQRKDGGYDASARAPLEDVEEALGLKLANPEEASEIDTLAGLVFQLVGRVPQRGEVIRHPAGVEFEVVEADPRRLRKLRIHRTAPALAQAEDDALRAAPSAGR
jgi:CBS domain containing-hemolysin-like protein